jgi:hypothetical protein
MTESQLIYRTQLDSFVDFAFRELNPGKSFLPHWHITLMAELIQTSYQETRHDKRRLIFNLPPGYLKTHVCSVSFPAWLLGRNPRKSVLILSEYPESALQIQEQCAELMSSSRYRSIFPRAAITGSSKALELNYGGGIRHAGVGYTSYHKKSDIVIIDNPQNIHGLDRFRPEQFTEIERLLKNPKEGVVVMATRRLGENDLSAFLARKPAWTKIPLPAVALKDRIWPFPPEIPHQQKAGDLLHPSLESWNDLERHLKDMGGEAFSYQYLQGLYSPSSDPVTETHEKDGKTYISISKPSPTKVTMKFLNDLRAQSKNKPLCMT